MDIKHYINKIEEIVKSKRTTKFEIDLNKPLNEHFNEIAYILQLINKPVLYWFECSDENDAHFIYDLYNVKRPVERASPPINKNVSKVLYLGVHQGGKYKREKKL